MATVTEAASLYIANAPTVTSGTTYALKVAAGNSIFGGNLYAYAGDVSAPSLAFSGDTNTGMYNIGPDNLGFSTGGVKRLDISNNLTTSKNRINVQQTESTSNLKTT